MRFDCVPSYPCLRNGHTYKVCPRTQPVNIGPTPGFTRHIGFSFWEPGSLHIVLPCFSARPVAKGTPADS